MKKQILSLILFLSLLTGCGHSSNDDAGTNSSQSSTTTISSLDSSTDDSSSSSINSSSSSSSSEEQKIYEKVTIKEANELCDKIVLTEEVNNVSNKYVSITGRMMFAESINCTQKGYRSDNAYKLFVFDETGYIYVGVNADRYNNVFSKYEYGDTSYYTFKGVLNNYLGQNELIMEDYVWEHSVPTNLNYDLLKSFTGSTKSMAEIYSLDNKLKVNNKGIAYGGIVSFEGKYVDKVENAVALFANEEYVIRVHGHSKLNNNFNSVKTEEELNNSKTYVVIGVLTMYNYIPEIQYLDSKISENNINYNLTKATKITAKELWKLTPDKDKLKNSHYQEYENVAQQIHYFEGYVSYSYYSGKINMVLTDEYNENYFNSALNEQNGKALRINNESETGLNKESDIANTKFGAFYESENGDKKIRVYFTTYGYNTNHYWQIQILNVNNITVIE
ncbi:MAG TPA: hypothetical protein DDW20_01905 [Firmicutes bacterium]|nr:hypothetical protein [Bacillota bacterium]